MQNFNAMASRKLARGTIVQIDTENRVNRVGVTQSMTGTSVWFSSPSRFETGEHLSLKFRSAEGATDLEIPAVVVETRTADFREGKLFRYATRARLETTLQIQRDDPTKPTRLDNPTAVAQLLQHARDEWLLNPDPVSLRHELVRILDLLEDE